MLYTSNDTAPREVSRPYTQWDVPSSYGDARTPGLTYQATKSRSEEEHVHLGYLSASCPTSGSSKAIKDRTGFLCSMTHHTWGNLHGLGF